ncbi:hypothetical protein BDDG_13024, partial [Blastomyces dermatitidis ATCC 18188]
YLKIHLSLIMRLQKCTAKDMRLTTDLKIECSDRAERNEDTIINSNASISSVSKKLNEIKCEIHDSDDQSRE